MKSEANKQAEMEQSLLVHIAGTSAIVHVLCNIVSEAGLADSVDIHSQAQLVLPDYVRLLMDQTNGKTESDNDQSQRRGTHEDQE